MKKNFMFKKNTQGFFPEKSRLGWMSRHKAFVLLFSGAMGLSLCLGLPIARGAVKGGGAAQQDPSATTLKAKGQINAPKGTPTFEIQEIERKLESYDTSKEASAAQKEENRRIKREILNGAFDLRELSQLALDKHWGGLSASEQARFVGLMTDLLETKAIFSKEHSKTQGNSYTVNYKGDRFQKDKSVALTLTEIYVPKENVTLDIQYRLKKSGGGWKVFDVIVDNASLVENYRYQFDSIISKHGYPELVNRMQKKLQELRTQAS